MNKALVVTIAITALASAVATAEAPVIASDPDARTALELTVYNQDLALVRETRVVALPEGPSYLEFRGVPARIEPRSLIVDRTDGAPFTLLEQSYEFDLMSRAKILEKYVGRELCWIQEDGRRVTGTLLGTAEGPVYEVDGEIVFEVPGRITLPSLPRNLRARPTLVWRLDVPRAGDRELDASYLTGGLSWSADYVLQLDAEGEEADVQAWVSVENRSGTTFDDAVLMLLAGDVNRVRREMAMGGMMPEAMMARDMASAPVQEAVGDYHMYTVPGRTVLKDREIKQISLFTAAGVPVTKHYRLDARRPRVTRGTDGGGTLEKVGVVYEVRNEEDGSLGLPLPAGVVRVYGRSSSGSRQLLGEDRIDHTTRGETLWLETGDAFDLVAERTRIAHRKRGERSWETTWSVELRNGGEHDVMIEVFESFHGDWTLQAANLPHESLSAHLLRFDVAVPAGGSSTLEYRVLTTR